MQTYASSVPKVPSLKQVRHRQTRRTWLLVIVGTILAAGFGVVAAKLVGGGVSALQAINPPQLPGGIVVFPLLLVVPAICRWPRATIIALLAGTTVIDQFPYAIGLTKSGAVLYKGLINVPLFRSLTKGSFVTPAELVLVLLLIIWLTKGARDHDWHAPRSSLSKSVAAMYFSALFLGVGLGLAHHGQIKIALWELRPWYYVAVMYLLTSAFFVGRDMLRPLLWTIVLGSGAKSMEGVYNFFARARHLTPRPEQILSHEESFFFALFLLTALALWLYQVKGRLRIVATVLVPFVLIADLGNSRRTAFLLLYAGIVALLVIAFVGMPERRPVLKKVNVVLAMLALVYLGLFWNHGGTLGQPARAVHSAVAPNTRDLESNQYRVIENANLQLNIHVSHSIGVGFGVPINYVYTIVNLTNLDSVIAFIPHNGVLYIWYRLGLLGEIVLWSMVGLGILTGCRLAKHQDKETAIIGALATCAIICYVLQGYNDLGFEWLRIAIFMGFMLGALEVTSQRARGEHGPIRRRIPRRTDRTGPPPAESASPEGQPTAVGVTKLSGVRELEPVVSPV